MTTVTTSTISDVIDGLLTTFRAMSAVTSATPPVPVFDGTPATVPPDRFMQVGGGVDPITAEGDQDWASLGVGGGYAPTRDEHYYINCYASAYVGGVDAESSSASDAQKTARDQAFALVAAAETALRADPVLITGMGGTGLGTGWVAFGGREQLSQTPVDDPDLGKGRWATVSFQVHVFARLSST